MIWTGLSKPPERIEDASAIIYRLAFADPRFGMAPEWLLVSESADLTRTGRGEEVIWRLAWRRLSLHGSRDRGHESIYLVGMDPMPGSTAEQIAAYDAFYTATHVPEVATAGGYSSGARYELSEQHYYSQSRAPRFCAVYEADAAATARKLRSLEQRAVSKGSGDPAFSHGPAAWEGRVTAWRLLYRRVAVLAPSGTFPCRRSRRRPLHRCLPATSTDASRLRLPASPVP